MVEEEEDQGVLEVQSSLTQSLRVCRQVYSQCSLSDVCLCNDTGLSVKEKKQFYFELHN